VHFGILFSAIDVMMPYNFG